VPPVHVRGKVEIGAGLRRIDTAEIDVPPAVAADLLRGLGAQEPLDDVGGIPTGPVSRTLVRALGIEQGSHHGPRGGNLVAIEEVDEGGANRPLLRLRQAQVIGGQLVPNAPRQLEVDRDGQRPAPRCHAIPDSRCRAGTRLVRPVQASSQFCAASRNAAGVASGGGVWAGAASLTPSRNAIGLSSLVGVPSADGGGELSPWRSNPGSSPGQALPPHSRRRRCLRRRGRSRPAEPVAFQKEKTGSGVSSGGGGRQPACAAKASPRQAAGAANVC
jgi:hypothetical protein